MFLSAPQTYYLYGLPTTYNSSESNSYLYGEKEFEQRQGLNVYDFLITLPYGIWKKEIRWERMINILKR